MQIHRSMPIKTSPAIEPERPPMIACFRTVWLAEIVGLTVADGATIERWGSNESVNVGVVEGPLMLTLVVKDACRPLLPIVGCALDDRSVGAGFARDVVVESGSSVVTGTVTKEVRSIVVSTVIVEIGTPTSVVTIVALAGIVVVAALARNVATAVSSVNTDTTSDVKTDQRSLSGIECGERSYAGRMLACCLIVPFDAQRLR